MKSAFLRGFKAGWQEEWSRLSVAYFLQKLFDAGIVIFFWELFNGRVL